jgi:hypothetical protein
MDPPRDRYAAHFGSRAVWLFAPLGSRAVFAKAAKDWNVPGLAVAVVHKGQLVLA